MKEFTKTTSSLDSWVKYALPLFDPLFPEKNVHIANNIINKASKA